MRIIAEARAISGQYKVTDNGPARYILWRRSEWNGQWVIVEQYYTRREALAAMDDELLEVN